MGDRSAGPEVAYERGVTRGVPKLRLSRGSWATCFSWTSTTTTVAFASSTRLGLSIPPCSRSLARPQCEPHPDRVADYAPALAAMAALLITEEDLQFLIAGRGVGGGPGSGDARRGISASLAQMLEGAMGDHGDVEVEWSRENLALDPILVDRWEDSCGS